MKVDTFSPPDPEINIVRCKLNDDKWDRLKKYLDEQIDDAFSGRDENRWKTAIAQYNSRLIPPGMDDREAQVDSSLTRDRGQQFIANILNPIFQQDQIFIVLPRYGLDESVARGMTLLSDYLSDRVDDQQFAYDFLEQSLIFPASVYAVVWEQRSTKVKRWQRVSRPVFDGFGQPVGVPGPDGEVIQEEVEEWQEVEETRELPPRARPVCIPLTDFAMEPGAESPETARCVFWRQWLTKSELLAGIADGAFEKDAKEVIEDGDAVPKEPDGTRLEFDERSSSINKKGKFYEVYECYLSYDIDDDGQDEEIVVTYMKSAGLRLRCVYNWWHEFPRPFGTFAFKTQPNTWIGQSLCYIAEPHHRIHGGQLRLRLASAVNANEPIIIDRSGILKEHVRNGRIRRGYIHAKGLGNINEEVQQWFMGQSVPAEAALAQLGHEAEQALDALIGLTPYLRGVEAIQRPTATGQMALIEAGKQMLFLAMERFTRELARMHRIRMAMYKQFFPSGVTIWLQTADPESSAVVSEFVRWPDGVLEDQLVVETKVSSATMNMNLKKQETLAMMDKFPEIIGTIAQLAQDATSPTPFSPVAHELLRVYLETVRIWLVDFKQDVHQLLPRIEQSMEEANVLGQILQENEQLRAMLGMGGAGQPGSGPEGAAQPAGGGGVSAPAAAAPPGAGPPGQGNVEY